MAVVGTASAEEYGGSAPMRVGHFGDEKFAKQVKTPFFSRGGVLERSVSGMKSRRGRSRLHLSSIF